MRRTTSTRRRADVGGLRRSPGRRVDRPCNGFGITAAVGPNFRAYAASSSQAGQTADGRPGAWTTLCGQRIVLNNQWLEYHIAHNVQSVKSHSATVSARYQVSILEPQTLGPKTRPDGWCAVAS